MFIEKLKVILAVPTAQVFQEINNECRPHVTCKTYSALRDVKDKKEYFVVVINSKVLLSGFYQHVNRDMKERLLPEFGGHVFV